MGRRGPAPAPTHLKVLRGERKDRINRDEPSPDEDDAVVPPQMSSAARAVWDALAPDLIQQRVLTSWDVFSFAAFCAACARAAEAQAHLEAEGEVIESPVFDRNGKPAGVRHVKSPWFDIWRSSVEICNRIGAKFGLTPSDRSQISVKRTEPKPKSNPGRLLSGPSKYL